MCLGRRGGDGRRLVGCCCCSSERRRRRRTRAFSRLFELGSRAGRKQAARRSTVLTREEDEVKGLPSEQQAAALFEPGCVGPGAPAKGVSGPGGLVRARRRRWAGEGGGEAKLAEARREEARKGRDGGRTKGDSEHERATDLPSLLVSLCWRRSAGLERQETASWVVGRRRSRRGDPAVGAGRSQHDQQVMRDPRRDRRGLRRQRQQSSPAVSGRQRRAQTAQAASDGVRSS